MQNKSYFEILVWNLQTLYLDDYINLWTFATDSATMGKATKAPYNHRSVVNLRGRFWNSTISFIHFKKYNLSLYGLLFRFLDRKYTFRSSWVKKWRVDFMGQLIWSEWLVDDLVTVVPITEILVESW